MVVLESAELWSDDAFLGTKIIYSVDGNVYASLVPTRKIPQDMENLALDRVLIPPEDRWLPYAPEYTEAPSPPSAYFVKRPSLLPVGDSPDFKPCEELLRELRVCEVLGANPHPNMARYWGCERDGRWITGLCFERYEVSLQEFAETSKPSCVEYDVDEICGRIRRGIEHLHSLGYVHNDIKPGNVMLTHHGQPVIIDFDSCQPLGEALGPKGWGTTGWEGDRCGISHPDNDFAGLLKIQEWLTALS